MNYQHKEYISSRNRTIKGNKPFHKIYFVSQWEERYLKSPSMPPSCNEENASLSNPFPLII